MRDPPARFSYTDRFIVNIPLLENATRLDALTGVTAGLLDVQPALQLIASNKCARQFSNVAVGDKQVMRDGVHVSRNMPGQLRSRSSIYSYDVHRHGASEEQAGDMVQGIANLRVALSVEIKTGTRRVIDYLLSPLRTQAEQSMRER